MNFKRIASCFLAAAAICMTCSLSACRKEDGNVGDGANHAPESRHTDNPIEDLMTDEHDRTNDHMATATPAATPTMLP